MSEQYCPSCNEKSFTWSIHEDKTPNTIWNCSLCKYQAEENESLEDQCETCGTKSKLSLKDKSKYFCYCTSCQNITKSVGW
jgi:hypothetical protein